jgi:hypothetical protein
MYSLFVDTESGLVIRETQNGNMYASVTSLLFSQHCHSFMMCFLLIVGAL